MIDPKKEFLRDKKLRRSKNYLIKSSRWLLIEVLKKNTSTISIAELTSIISSGAFYFTLLLFTFPIALPLPYPPGLPSLCGIPIFLLCLQMIFKPKTVFLPKFVKDYKVSIELITKIIKKSHKIFKFLSKIIKVGRMEYLASSMLIPFYGVFAAIMSIGILIPFPGTNFVPAVAIFLICLGILFHDGLLLLISILLGLIATVIVYFVTFYFASFSAKFFKAAYIKISNLYLSETTVAFIGGIFVGMIGAFCIVLIGEILFKKLFKKKK